ncbi:MAG TPA: dihydrodipicolinate synthase family protein [Beijerinckiaceae bacterium]|nr:dihydrodipicolinate synthase family protein [Beijerinckiaceae bacterium]
MLTGVFPVLPTPFTPEGAVDEAAFLRLVDFALACGVDGLVFPGMASEVETLSPQERASLVAALGKRLAGRVPFIVGASDADPERAAARAEEGRAAGAVAAMVMAPNPLGRDVGRQTAFYAAVAGGTRLPLMLQNAPAPMGAGLDPAEVAAVARAVEAVRFVKEETLPCGQHVTRILEAAGGALDAVYGGAGARYVLDELARGAAGTMPALELADVHVDLMAAWRRGDRAGARRLYTASLPLLVVQMVFRVRLTKEVLRRRGLLASTVARAAGPVLDAGDLAEIDALLAEAGPIFRLHPPGAAA